jgi:sugar phosphate permease
MVVYLQRLNISVLLVDTQFLKDMGLLGQGARQGLLMTCFLLAYSIINLLAAPLGDRIGPRKTMFFGIILASIAMVIGGIAWSLEIVLIVRIILGVGQGIYFPAQIATVRRWFPPRERGRANALYGLGGSIGLILAVPLFTYLIEQSSWRAVFFVPAILGFIITLPLIFRIITDDPEDNHYISQKETQWLKEQFAEEATELAEGIGMNHTGARAILSSSSFWMVCVSYMAYLSIWWGILTWLPQYLVVARHYSVQGMSILATVPYLFSMFGLLFGGCLSDRLERHSVFCFVGLLGAAGCILAASLVPSDFLAAILMAVGVGCIQIYYAPIWVLLQSLLPVHLIGTGTGLMNGISNLVSATSPFIIGFLIQITGNYTSGLLYLVGFGLIGSLSCLFLFKHELGEQKR